jgi:hypothetical protein
MDISLTFDVEEDLHTGGIESLKVGMPRLFKILDRHNIKSTLFVPALLLKKYPKIFRNFKRMGHEIALHGYAHERFDNLSHAEKELRIKKAVQIYKKIFREYPEGFRAPQLSIDRDTLEVLCRNKFSYDSSCSPLNFFQLLFFPKRFKQWLNNLLKPLRVYRIKDDFYEVPLSSFFVPFTSIILRVSNFFLIKQYLKLLILTNGNLVFFAHSWDFIELKNSRLDRKFPHRKFIKNFDFLIGELKKEHRFLKTRDMIEKLKSNT